jgi:hypothetical protein
VVIVSVVAVDGSTVSVIVISVVTIVVVSIGPQVFPPVPHVIEVMGMVLVIVDSTDEVVVAVGVGK